MIENSRIKNYHNCSLFLTQSFSKPGIKAVFAFTKSRFILYNEILFYVVNTFFFFFFSLGRNASMRINELASKEN